MNRIFLLIFSVFIICGLEGISQADEALADDHFKHRNYFKAMEEYGKLLRLDRDDPKYNMRMAECYLYTNLNKVKAVVYLERIIDHKRADKEVPYLLAWAYMLDYRMDDAIKYLNIYLEKPGSNEEAAKKKLLDCKTAKELMAKPVQVHFENMGESINSEGPDYNPFVSSDETTLIFTTRRDIGSSYVEFDGYYSSDVMISTYDGSRFTKARELGTLNSKYNEQCTGISHDGQTMFFYSDKIQSGQLFTVPRSGSSFGRKKEIEVIQEDKALESSVSISPDGNTLIYASNRSGGKGGLDLYMIRKLPFGENMWAEPQAITALNTEGNEDFPSFSEDGKTIYFSSNGLPGMGGYDVYSSNWDPETNTYSTPSNLGYPLNTPYDELTISFAGDDKHAYIASARPGGIGDLDIYRVTYDAVEVIPAIFNIRISNGNTDKPAFIAADLLTILNASGDVVGEYAPNEQTKEYTVILSPGQYQIIVDAESQGYETHKSDFKVSEFMNRMGKIDKIITLKKGG